MSTATKIGWTDHTFNPWWGCTKVSPACDHCYAESFAKRTGHQVWGKDGERRFFGDKHWAEPIIWNRRAHEAGRPARVFCASMADVFEARDDLDPLRARLWALIESTPWLIWQLLTKRPEQVRRRVPGRWLYDWPRNVWLGVTVEDPIRAGIRIPRLVECPAPVRFLSIEPLLADLTGIDLTTEIDWIIVGGESGAGHRPIDPEWVRAIRDECVSAGVPFFLKQWGGRTPTAAGRLLDGRTWDEVPAVAVPA